MAVRDRDLRVPSDVDSHAYAAAQNRVPTAVKARAISGDYEAASTARAYVGGQACRRVNRLAAGHNGCVDGMGRRRNREFDRGK